MAARSGMLWLIEEVRANCDLGTADYAVGDTTYWADEQIQQELDKYRTALNRVALTFSTDYVGGTAQYLDYYAPSLGYYEDATSGTVAWQVEDSDGNDVGTANYTANYQNGHIRFNADRGGTAYYLKARSYNVNRAAAAIWRRKAAHYALAYDFAADQQRFNRSQMRKAALEMAQHYDAQGGVMSVKMVRSDLL